MSKNIDECIAYAKYLNENVIVELHKSNRTDDEIKKLQIEKNIEEPKLTTFGDTIILTWVTPPGLESIYIDCLEPYIIGIIPYGLYYNLLLRGAISCGEFIISEDSSTILGPAVHDAAFWYEEAQWIGIIATPKCGFVIENSYNLSSSTHSKIWNKYNVKISNGDEKGLWCVDWFLAWKEICEGLLLSECTPHYIFGKMNIPKGTEDKYFNTIEYYEWCSKKERNKLEGLSLFANADSQRKTKS